MFKYVQQGLFKKKVGYTLDLPLHTASNWTPAVEPKNEEKFGCFVFIIQPVSMGQLRMRRTNSSNKRGNSYS